MASHRAVPKPAAEQKPPEKLLLPQNFFTSSSFQAQAQKQKPKLTSILSKRQVAGEDAIDAIDATLHCALVASFKQKLSKAAREEATTATTATEKIFFTSCFFYN